MFRIPSTFTPEDREKFQAQCGPAESLATWHYDHDTDDYERRVSWPVAIEAMVTDLLALGMTPVWAELHADRLNAMTGGE